MAADVQDTLEGLIARIRRVRHWLVALGLLRTAAIGLACLSMYIGLYAWIDHHAHFGHWGRLLALCTLLALLVGLAYLLVRTLRRDLPYSRAAYYVESRRNFDQQLVAAVEYYEGRADYPYSRSLAERLVVQVDEATRDFRFDATIEKWRGYVLAALILLGLVVVALFIRYNILYFSSYLARLLQPFSHVEPARATALDSVTQDIVTARDAPVTLTAAVHGRAPESATLILTRQDVNDVNEPAREQSERIETRPTVDAQGTVTFAATRSFDSVEDLTYRFEAGGVSSDTHTIAVRESPAVKGITATVSLPRVRGGQPARTYKTQVTDGALEVLPHSLVDLQVDCTTPLRQAGVATAGEQPKVQALDAADAFGFRFTADKPASMEFALVSADGLPNREPQQLQIRIKADEPPQFKLVSPDGDYLTTDVASLPIAFEITDDFGLDSAQLWCEFPDRNPVVVDSNAPQGATRTGVAFTLELEQYPVTVGDSVLFYAKAADIDTGQRTTDANHCSEVYFIEIRPYRQYWHPQPGGGKPSSQPGPVPEDLITILEYTRAILKKTWTQAHLPELTDESRSRLDALCADVEHCERGLAHTRDNTDYDFSEADKAALNEIISRYRNAGDALRRHDAGTALPPVRDAYRLLRQFVDELHLKWTPPQSGQSVPEEKPERVKLQDQPQTPEMEQQRVENQLEQVQREIEMLTREQKSLNANLDNTLRQQEQAANESQASSASSASASPGGSSGQPAENATREQESSDAHPDSARRQQEQAANDPQASSASSASTSPSGSSGQPAENATREQERSDVRPESTPQQQEQAASESQASSTASASASPGGSSSQATNNGPKDQQDRASQNAQDADLRSTPDDGTQGQDSGHSADQGGPAQAERGSQQARESNGQQGSPGDQSSSSSSSSGQAGAQGAEGSAGRQGSAASDSPDTTGSRQSQEARSSGGAQGSAGAGEARLRMLEARQKALRAQASEVQADLQRLPADELSPHGQARNEANEHLRQAIEKMKAFENRMVDMRYEPAMSPQSRAEASELADSVSRQLAEAGRTVRKSLSADEQQTAGEKARDMAEQLAEDAQALDESLSPAERERMLERLEAAQRLLESMAGPQWTTVSGGAGSASSHVYTRSAPMPPAETARMLARQFWSMAVEAREKDLRPMADEPSDVEFFEAEREFFENAARFQPQRTRK